MSDKVELDIKGYAEVRDSHPQPTASVDAEQVWREALGQFLSFTGRSLYYRYQTATAVIQAYGDARADAARREALEEAAKVADEGYRIWGEPRCNAAEEIATTIRAMICAKP